MNDICEAVHASHVNSEHTETSMTMRIEATLAGVQHKSSILFAAYEHSHVRACCKPSKPFAPERRACPYLGGMTVCWFGLCIAEAILAMSLLHATPAEHVYPACTQKLFKSMGVLMGVCQQITSGLLFQETPITVAEKHKLFFLFLSAHTVVRPGLVSGRHTACTELTWSCCENTVQQLT